MFASIRWRIAVPYVLLILIMMGGIFVYVSTFVRQTYIDNLRDKLAAEARLVADDLIPLLSSNPNPEQLDALAKHWASLLDARVTLIGAGGVVLGESHENRLKMENHLTRPEVQQALASGQGSSIRYSETVKYSLLYVAIPILVDGKVDGFVRISLPLQKIDADIARLQMTLLQITLVTAILAVMIALFITSRATRPLRELTVAARQMTSGEMGQTLIPTNYSEVEQLALAFHEMASELDERIHDLKSESSKLSAILQEMTDGVVLIDPEGRVNLINPAAQRLFGLDEAAAKGKSAVEVLRHYQLVDLWKMCQQTGKVQQTALELSGQNLFLQGVAVPLGEALSGSILLLIQNLTYMRRLETVRRDFISNLSHELRTPLSSLKALAETLKEGALEDHAAARHFLEQMEIEVDALAQMTSELLELSRIESGKVALHFSPVAPLDLIQAAVERLRLQADRAGLSIEIACSPDLPPALADQTRIEQVLVNLLHNAIKFSPTGGNIRVSGVEQGKNILFSVQDTGIGIAPESLSRIFERFYKADRARSKGGTGLGLSIAKHMVESHRGRIWAESVAGQGSIFYFTLPVANHSE